MSPDSPSAKNMNMPYDGVFSNGTQLFVDDQKNEADPGLEYVSNFQFRSLPMSCLASRISPAAWPTTTAADAPVARLQLRNLSNPTGIVQIWAISLSWRTAATIDS